MHTGLITQQRWIILKKSKHLVQNFRNKDTILKRDGNYSLQFLFDDDDDDDDDDDNNNKKNKWATICVTELINYATTHS